MKVMSLVCFLVSSDAPKRAKHTLVDRSLMTLFGVLIMKFVSILLKKKKEKKRKMKVLYTYNAYMWEFKCCNLEFISSLWRWTKFIDGVRSVSHNQCKFIHIVVGPRVVIMAMGISYFYVIQHSSWNLPVLKHLRSFIYLNFLGKNGKKNHFFRNILL